MGDFTWRRREEWLEIRSMNRRNFTETTAVTALAMGIAQRLLAREAENAYREDIGIQLYTLRDQLAKDTVGTLKKVAAMTKDAGIRLSYHNHNFEFQPHQGGKRGYDIFTEEFSSDMHFEIDVFWVKAAGLDPAELIRKLSGRVTQLHLKDLKKGIDMPSYLTSLPNDAFQPLGQGIIPVEPILVAAKAADVENCHVEQDQSPDPLADIRKSLGYLRTL